MKYFVTTYLIIILISVKLVSQQWQSIGPPGGSVTALAINPQQPNIVFAATSNDILFKSEDAVLTSTVIFDTIDFLYAGGDIVFNPINPEIMYVGSNKSLDGGKSWKHLTGFGTIVYNPKNPNKIFSAAYGKQILVSNDAGISWTLLHEFNYCGTIVISLSDTNVIYAETANDTAYVISKSTDSGNTWQETSLKVIPPNRISSIVVNPLNSNVVYLSTNDNGIFKTLDGGITWNLTLTTVAINDLAINPNDTSIVYAVSGDYLASIVGNVFKTTNGGYSWSILNDGLPSDYNRYIYHVEINPQNSEEVYIGMYGFGVYKTSTGGADWQWTKLTKAAVTSISFHPSHADYIYAGTYDEGIVRTTDGGNTWTLLSLNATTTVQTFFRQLQFNPQNPNVAYLTAGPYGLLKSTNGGSTWLQTSFIGSPDTWAWSIAIHPTNPETLFVGQTGWLVRDLYRSSNGGSTWENLQVMNSIGSAQQIKFNSTNANVMYLCAADIGFHKSTNSGQTWLSMNTGLKISEVPLVSPVLSVEINIGTENVLYVAQGAAGKSIGGVLKSTDGGEHWFAIDSALALMDFNLDVQDICFSPNDQNLLYASLESQGQIYTSTYSAGGLYITLNDGVSWKRVFNGASQEIKFDLHNSNQLYLATKAGIFLANENEILSAKKIDCLYPNEITLYQNYPNPFNPRTTIRYAVKHSGNVMIRLFNILGKEVRQYQRGISQPGEYEIQWDGKDENGQDVSSGVYFYRLETPYLAMTKKLLLLR
jgi:photosystem II stability/assembly factor-like uncharacterized protein